MAFYEAGLQFVYDRPHPDFVLSPHEMAVLTLVGEGHDLVGVANRLCVSEETIRRRKRSIKRKLGLKTDTELVLAYGRTRTPENSSRARYMVEKILPALAGAVILSPILRDEDWCGLLVKLPSGVTKRVWLLASETGEHCGWVLVD